MAAARQNRHGHRDATMILVTFRHGLRATEVCQLRRDQYDLTRGTLHVNRIKNGIESVHPVGGEELRALRKLHREEVENRYVFVSERGAPLTHEGFLKMVKRAGVSAKLPFSAHPHMLRHACGYKLANDGHDTCAIQLYMGHKNIQNTVGYTQLSAGRFKDFGMMSCRGYRHQCAVKAPIVEKECKNGPKLKLPTGRYASRWTRNVGINGPKTATLEH